MSASGTVPRLVVVVSGVVLAGASAAAVLAPNPGAPAFLGDPKATLAITVAAIAAVALYASAFVWLGLVTMHAVAI